MRYHHGRDVDDGLAAAEQALKLNPDLAAAYCVRARHFAKTASLTGPRRRSAGRWSSIPIAGRPIAKPHGSSMQHRRTKEATHHYELAAALDENDFHSCMMLLTCFQADGMRERLPEVAHQMLERSERVLAKDSLNASALGVSAAGLPILGDMDRAKERLQRAMMVDPDNINMPYNFACMLANWVGDIEGALDMLEPMMQRQSRSLIAHHARRPRHGPAARPSTVQAHGCRGDEAHRPD